MLSGGATGSYQIHQVGSVPEPPVSQMTPADMTATETTFRFAPNPTDSPQQMLYLGPLNPSGTEPGISQNSGTSAESSQLGNSEKYPAECMENGHSKRQLHKGAPRPAEDQRDIANGSDPSCEPEEWAEIRNEKVPASRHPPDTVPDVRMFEAGPSKPGLFHASNGAIPSAQSAGFSLLGRKLQQEEQNMESHSETGRAYPGEAVHNVNAKIFPVYSRNDMTSESYKFPTGREILGVPSKNATLQSNVSLPSDVQGEEALFGALYPSQNLVRRGYPAPALTLTNWTSIATQYVNNSLVDSNVHSRVHGMSTIVGNPLRVSSFLSESVQENSFANEAYTHDRIVSSFLCSSQMQVESIQVSQDQQNSLCLPLPPAALEQNAVAQGLHGGILSSTLAHQTISSSRSGQHIVANQGYENLRNGGNELLFLPGSDSTGQSEPFPSQVHSRVLPEPYFQNGDASPSIGSFQGLSLSLSSQGPSSSQMHLNHGRSESDLNALAAMTRSSVDLKGKGVACIASQARYNCALSRFHLQRDDLGVSAEGLPSCGQKAAGEHNFMEKFSDPVPPSYWNTSIIQIQDLLHEFCGFTKRHKRMTKDQFRPQSSSWSQGQPTNGSTGCRVREFLAPDSTKKQFMINFTQLPGSSAAFPEFRRGQEAALEVHHVLQSGSREDVELKKVTMQKLLEEMDRRYRAYVEKLMGLTGEFNSTVCPGTAGPYTVLALQAMSRHFKGLKVCLSSQLIVVRRALGEQEKSHIFAGKDPTSIRFKTTDEQLRQQRALQQLSMLQQHPQRGFPERAVTLLRQWLFGHFLHPYPKVEDKQTLARQTGLTRSQVSNWFINARVRFWKPMVEEMFMEESGTTDEIVPEERYPVTEYRRGNEQMENGEGHRFSVFTLDALPSETNAPNCTFGTNQTHGSTSGHMDFGAPTDSILKKARTGRYNSDDLSTSVVSKEIDSAGQSPFQNPYPDNGSFHALSAASDDHSQRQDVWGSHGGRFVAPAHARGSLSGFPGSFIPGPTASATGGLSLTLGLRHSDGLSLYGAPPQQNYRHEGESSNPLRSNDHPAVENGARNMDNVNYHCSPDEDDHHTHWDPVTCSH